MGSKGVITAEHLAILEEKMGDANKKTPTFAAKG
jgi:hypothetical protein